MSVGKKKPKKKNNLTSLDVPEIPVKIQLETIKT